MAGLERARRTGAAGGDRESGHVKLDQLRIGGDTGHMITGNRGNARGLVGDHRAAFLADRVIEMLTQFRRPSRPVGRCLQRCSHAENIGQILGAGSISLFLATIGMEQPEIPDQQGADPGRATEFVPGNNDQVGVRQGQLAHRLRTVGQ